MYIRHVNDLIKSLGSINTHIDTSELDFGRMTFFDPTHEAKKGFLPLTRKLKEI